MTALGSLLASVLASLKWVMIVAAVVVAYRTVRALLDPGRAALQAICYRRPVRARLHMARLRPAALQEPDDLNGWRLLERAVHHRLPSTMIYLLNRGISPNHIDAFGKSTLFLACELRDVSLVGTLLKHGAAPDVGTDEGVTPLMLSVAMEERSVVAALLDGGANPNIADAFGCTALHWAASGPQDIIDLLIRHGADPKISDAGNRLALESTNEEPTRTEARSPRQQVIPSGLVASESETFSFRSGVHVIEYHGKRLGREIFIYDGRVVSKKRNLSSNTVAHQFTVSEDGAEVTYEINADLYAYDHRLKSLVVKRNGVIAQSFTR